MSLGWTWEQVAEQMDFPRLSEMHKHWSKFPPLHKMVADYLGITKNARAESVEASAETLSQDILSDLGID